MSMAWTIFWNSSSASMLFSGKVIPPVSWWWTTILLRRLRCCSGIGAVIRISRTGTPYASPIQDVRPVRCSPGEECNCQNWAAFVQAGLVLSVMLKSSVTPSAMNRQAVTICHCRLKLRLISCLRLISRSDWTWASPIWWLVLTVSSTALLTQNGWRNKPLGGNVSMTDVVTLLNARCGSGIITALIIWKSLMIIPTGSGQGSIKPAARNGLPISAETTFISWQLTWSGTMTWL